MTTLNCDNIDVVVAETIIFTSSADFGVLFVCVPWFVLTVVVKYCLAAAFFVKASGLAVSIDAFDLIC